MFKKQRYPSKQQVYSPVMEQMKMIRSSIDFSNVDHKKQVILITSPESGSGKSTISANLAATYAQKGDRTVLIDGDMRKPVLHKIFSKNPYYGLSNAIKDENTLEDNLQHVQTKGCSFSLLTSGPIPPNPSDLLASKKTMRLFAKLREDFDVIIVDTPPVIVVSDTLVLADLADGVILVCRQHKTLKEKSKQAVHKLQLSRAKLIGTILNGTKNAENYYY